MSASRVGSESVARPIVDRAEAKSTPGFRVPKCCREAAAIASASGKPGCSTRPDLVFSFSLDPLGEEIDRLVPARALVP